MISAVHKGNQQEHALESSACISPCRTDRSSCSSCVEDCCTIVLLMLMLLFHWYRSCKVRFQHTIPIQVLDIGLKILHG